MNVERLHVIAKAIRNDLRKHKIVTTLQNLIDALTEQIANPQDPEPQKQVTEHLTVLRKGLTISEVNDFSPTWLQVVEELEVSNLLGLRLRARINAIFSRNAITPTIALKELQAIHSVLSAFSTSLDHLLKAFADLSIGIEELDPGEAEVGVLVPRSYVHNHLDDFAKELSEIDKILKVFAEVSTGSRPGFEINTISSSDLNIYLAAIPPVAACVAVAVERIVSLYKQMLEIRKLKFELEKFEIEKEGLRAIDRTVKARMDKGIEQLVKELMNEFYVGEDDGRRTSFRSIYAMRLGKLPIELTMDLTLRLEPNRLRKKRRRIIVLVRRKWLILI